MIRLGVNIDHVATVRQARRAPEPDPVAAAVLALLGGADGITVHLREDRRHIQDRDVRLLREVVTRRLNLEMAAVDAVVEIACAVKPDEATLVPERREELTTEGGLDVVAHRDVVSRALEPWSFGMYAGGQSILVGTPSGVTLAPEGGAHQSAITAPIRVMIMPAI